MLKKLRRLRNSRSKKSNDKSTVKSKTQTIKKPLSILDLPFLVFIIPFVGWCFIFAKREDLDVSVWSSDFSRLLLTCVCRGSVFFFLAAYIKYGIDNIGVPGYLALITCVFLIGWYETKKILPGLMFFTIMFSLMFLLAGKYVLFHLCCATLNWLWLSWFSKRGDYEFTILF